MKKNEIIKRLDVIAYLLIEIIVSLPTKKQKKRSEIVRVLKNLGLTPTEIARILGYKSRTSIANMLYSKSAKKKEIEAVEGDINDK